MKTPPLITNLFNYISIKEIFIKEIFTDFIDHIRGIIRDEKKA
jgi:hypothetical protein